MTTRYSTVVGNENKVVGRVDRVYDTYFAIVECGTSVLRGRAIGSFSSHEEARRAVIDEVKNAKAREF